MTHAFDPRHLNIPDFAKSHSSYVGDERLARFERLVEETRGIGSETPVSYSLRGETRTNAQGHAEPWLHLAAQATLTLTCQRCLGPVDVPVAFERSFRFVADEALAANEDELSEEDVLAVSKSFNLLELLEDELLMDTPAAPKHTQCPQPVKLEAVDPDFDASAEVKPNPFAVLKQLKKESGN